MNVRGWVLAAVLGVTAAHPAAAQPSPGTRILVVPFEDAPDLFADLATRRRHELQAVLAFGGPQAVRSATSP